MPSVSVSFFFYHYDKTPDMNNLKGEKIYFGSQFQRLQSMVCCLHCFWACGEAEYSWHKHMVRQSCLSHSGCGGIENGAWNKL
jgi:hypothetical protein